MSLRGRSYSNYADGRKSGRSAGWSKQKAVGDVSDWIGPYKKEWAEVEKRRLRRLSEGELSELRASGTPIVDLRMILETKRDGRRKGRLILLGFREPGEWDVGSNDSPVASLASVRSMLFMKGGVDDVISSIDVSTAFLQSDPFPKDHPKRYVRYREYAGGPVHIYELTGAIYGQRSASMAWFRTLRQWLESEGFKPGEDEACAYVHPVSKLKVLTVVDDMIVRGSKQSTDEFYSKIASKFNMKDPDYLTPNNPLHFIGYDINMKEVSDGNLYSINQEQVVRTFLSEINFRPIYNIGSPMVSSTDIYKDNSELSEVDGVPLECPRIQKSGTLFSPRVRQWT